jgi:hypothetical protein
MTCAAALQSRLAKQSLGKQSNKKKSKKGDSGVDPPLG